MLVGQGAVDRCLLSVLVAESIDDRLGNGLFEPHVAGAYEADVYIHGRVSAGKGLPVRRITKNSPVFTLSGVFF